jgi:hypothetical protein
MEAPTIPAPTITTLDRRDVISVPAPFSPIGVANFPIRQLFLQPAFVASQRAVCPIPTLVFNGAGGQP